MGSSAGGIEGRSGIVFYPRKHGGVKLDSFEKQDIGTPHRIEYEAMRSSLPAKYRHIDALVDAAIKKYFSQPPQKNAGLVQITKSRDAAASAAVKEYQQARAVRTAKGAQPAERYSKSSNANAPSAASLSFARQAAVANHIKSAFDRFDAKHGVGALDHSIAQDIAKQEQINLQAMAQVNKEFGLVFASGPALAAIIVLPAAVAAGGDFIVAKTGLAGPAALLVKGGVGGTAGLAYTEGTTRPLFDRAPTAGERIGSFTIGAVFAPGVYSITSKFSAPVNGAINGGAAGGMANISAQIIDWFSGNRDSLSALEFGTDILIGSAAGGLGGTVQPYYGRPQSLGNSQSIAAGARVGAQEAVNGGPATVVSLMTQAHLDMLKAMAIPEAQAISISKPAK
jgi:hypothetical protein